MFTPQIVKFEKALENMDGKIKQLARALDTVNTKLAVIAGRRAQLAGRIGRRRYATSSSPPEGLITGS